MKLLIQAMKKKGDEEKENDNNDRNEEIAENEENEDDQDNDYIGDLDEDI